MLEGWTDHAQPRRDRVHDPVSDRDAALDAAHEVLPARWRVASPPSIAEPLLKTWSVTAIGLHPGRGKMPQTVTGTGPDEVSALRDLDEKLRGVDQSKGTWLRELRQRLRAVLRRGRRGMSRGTSADR